MASKQETCLVKVDNQSESSETTIVHCKAMYYYFEWPTSSFNPEVLQTLPTGPYDMNTAAFSWSMPGVSIHPRSAEAWIEELLRHAATLWNSSNEFNVLKAYLSGVFGKLPKTWPDDIKYVLCPTPKELYLIHFRLKMEAAVLECDSFVLFEELVASAGV